MPIDSNEAAVRSAFTNGAAPSQATLDQFAAEMRAKGIDPDATMAKHTPAQPGGPETSGRERLQVDVAGQTGDRITAAQAVEAAAQLRRFWSGDPAQLEAALAAAGQPAAAPATDERSPEQVEFDSSSLGVPTDPSEYDLGGLLVNSPIDVEDPGILARNVLEALHGFGVPKALAAATAADFLDAMADAEWLAEQDEAVQQSYILEQRAIVGRVLKIGYHQVIATIRPYVDRLSPASKAWLGSSGAVNRAQTLIRLYQTVTLQNHRKGLAKS